MAHGYDRGVDRRGLVVPDSGPECLFTTGHWLGHGLASRGEPGGSDSVDGTWPSPQTIHLEVFYNRQRRHSSLAYLSPVAYELQDSHVLRLYERGERSSSPFGPFCCQI